MTDVDDEVIRELWLSIQHLHLLQDTEAVSPAAELRRQESITRTCREIARLIHGEQS